MVRWNEPYFRPLEIEKLLTGANFRGFFFVDGNIWEFYDGDGKRGASIAPTADAYPPWEASAPIIKLLNWIYVGLGLRIVHAATLGADGRGVLIVGGGGAGKSGLTLAGVVAGLDSVGDDYVLIDPREQPTAYPVFRFAKQDSSGCRRLGLSRFLDDLGPLNRQGKHEFDFACFGRGKRAELLKINAILIANLTDRQDTAIRPVSRRNVMLALAPAGTLQLPGDRMTSTRLFADLVRQLPCYTIEIGRNPDHSAGAVAEFLEFDGAG
jgi:hypothetical protein